MQDQGLTSQHFDAESVRAMNDIAVLLHAYHGLAGMRKTFNDHPNTDLAEAKPLARRVQTTLKSVGADLLEALFHGERKRSTELAAACRSSLKALRVALDKARELAEAERQAYEDDPHAMGNVIETRVVRELERLVKNWTQIVAEGKREGAAS